MKKIAVCLSGQMRNWKLCVQSQKRFWQSAKIDVDYFIHTWDTSMDRSSVSEEYEHRNISDTEFDEYVREYDAKKFILDRKKQDFFYKNDHWASLFYSLSQSILLKRKYEIENNFEYDIVVKSRPDLVFDPRYSFTYEQIQDNVIYSSHGGLLENEFYGYNFNDCVFYSNSYTMDLLIDLYFYRIQKINLLDQNYDKRFDYIGPGILMRHFYSDFGLVGISSFEWVETIVRKGCPENLDLNQVDEFRKMEKYFREWYTR